MAACCVCDLEDYVSMSSLDDFPEIVIIIPDSIASLSLSLDCYFDVQLNCITKLTFTLTCMCPRLLPRRLLEMCHLGTSK